MLLIEIYRDFLVDVNQFRKFPVRTVVFLNLNLSVTE